MSSFRRGREPTFEPATKLKVGGLMELDNSVLRRVLR